MSFPQISQIGGYFSQIDTAKSELKTEAQKLGVNVPSANLDAFVTNASSSDLAVSAGSGKTYTDEEIQTTIDKYMELILTYDAQVQSLTMLINELQKQLDEEQEKYDFYREQYEAQEKEYKKLESSYEKKADDYSDIQKAIEKATENAEGEAKQRQKDAINNAMANYDESKDGDYQTYLQNSLKDVLDDTSLSGLITSLLGESQSVLKSLGSLNLKMSSVSREMSNWQTIMSYQEGIVNQVQSALTEAQIEETTVINNMDAVRTQLADIALSSLSDEELALVKDNNIDLTEKFPDGSPKYIVARGNDNKYHIYEYDSQGSTTATSLARKYGQNGGNDIVPTNSGYLENIQPNARENANVNNTVFYFDSISPDFSSGKAGAKVVQFIAKEPTPPSSDSDDPLVLDLNGDGVKTSEKDIMYDIDGDGILDQIKDAADGVLVFDADGDGISGENGKECFGNNTDLDGDGKADGYKDGFEALKAIAEKENLINGKDDNTLDANDIKLLEEKYGFKIKVEGYGDESISLLDIGITEINLAQTNATKLQKDYDGQGNDLMTQEGATFTMNGEEREYADIWHKHNKFNLDA